MAWHRGISSNISPPMYSTHGESRFSHSYNKLGTTNILNDINYSPPFWFIRCLKDNLYNFFSIFAVHSKYLINKIEMIFYKNKYQ